MSSRCPQTCDEEANGYEAEERQPGRQLSLGKGQRIIGEPIRQSRRQHRQPRHAGG
jgi:hypothetical protein